MPTVVMPETLRKSLTRSITAHVREGSLRLDPASMLARDTASIVCLRLTNDLLSGQAMDTLSCLQSDDVLVQSAMTSLTSGASPKMVGTQLAEALLASGAGQRQRILQLIADGCTVTYEGQTIAVALRHCHKGVATYANGNRYTGSWVAGRMHGRGCIETEDGRALYRGAFADNRPNGDGEMMDGRGNVMYRGQLRDGKYYGKGQFRDTSGKGKRDGYWVDGFLCDPKRCRTESTDDGVRTTLVGGFWMDKPHGQVTETKETETGVTIAKYSGSYCEGQRHGVGIQYVYSDGICTTGMLGIWWNDALCMPLARVHATQTLPAAMAQLPEIGGVNPSSLCPLQSWTTLQKASTQTQTESMTAARMQPPDPAGLLSNSAAPTARIPVMSVNVLTNIPRKEFVVQENASASALRGMIGTVDPAVIAAGSCIGLTDDRPLNKLIGSVHGAVCFPIFIALCPTCLKSDHMRVVDCHPALHMHPSLFIAMQCHKCANGEKICSPHNSEIDDGSCTVLYCRECGQRDPHSPLSFLRTAHALRHLIQCHSGMAQTTWNLAS